MLHKLTMKYKIKKYVRDARGAFRTHKMELFAKVIKEWKRLIIFAKISIFDVWPGSEYAINKRYDINKRNIFQNKICGRILQLL